MQGAPPLASPGLNPGGTGKGGEPRARRGLVPVGCQLTLPLWCPAGACFSCRLPPLPFRHPQGGLPFSSPAYPAFGLLSCPLSPRPPSPPGKGETKVFFMQGASPLASPGLNPGGTGSPCQSGTRRGGAFGISNPAQNRKNRFPMSSAGSQGEGGPGEMELSVASDGGV